MGKYVERARQLRPMIVGAAKSLPDEQAAETPELFEKWESGKQYSVGDKANYTDILYKCLQAHKSQDDWTPGIAVSLWARVLNPGPDIPVWVQPDSTNPYMKGDKVHYKTIDDPVYESTIDNNVWSPEAYPQGWKMLIDI